MSLDDAFKELLITLDAAVPGHEAEFAHIQDLLFGELPTSPEKKTIEEWQRIRAEKEKQPDISIPPGWVELTVGEPIREEGLYFYNDELKTWNKSRVWDLSNEYLYRRSAYKLHIKQVIDINLSRQPEELVAVGMDECGEWVAYANIPIIDDDQWFDDMRGYARSLLKSECPKDFNRPWKDSLLVRPEHWSNK